jgi:PAS domain S-box-containing protein
MSKLLRSLAVKYLMAVLAVAVATASHFALASWMTPGTRVSALPLFLAAVMLAAWGGGLGPGLLAAVLAAILINPLFVEPRRAGGPSLESAVTIVLFLGSAAFISSLVESRRRAEAAERRRRAWYEAMLTSVGDGVIATDHAGAVLFINAAAEVLTGWAEAEALGRPIDEVVPVEDGRTGIPVEGPVSRAIQLGEPTAAGPSAVLIDRTGRRRPIEGRAAVIRGSDGEVAGAVLVFRDVADRRRAEDAVAELAAIVASSQDAIICRGADDRITSWNPGAERLFGYAAVEAIGRPMTMLLPPDQSDEMPQMLTRIENGMPISHYESERIRKDGRRLDISLSISTLRDAGGRLVGAATIARDVTERRQAERRLATQYAVSRVLAESATVSQAVPRLLEALGEGLQWEVGTFWRIDRGAGRLRCVAVWHRGGIAFERFEKACGDLSFGPGEGLPGRVWSGGVPGWVAEIADDGPHPRAAVATAGGLRGGVAFPIRQGDEVIAVAEFFSCEAQPPDPALLGMLRVVGSQVGLFVERKKAEADLRLAEARFRRLADSGVLGILITDLEDLLVLEANDAFLAMVGATREDLAAGRLDWAELTPPEYSEVDARAVAQLRATGVCDTFVKEYLRLDGSRVSVLVGAAMLEESSASCIAFLIDITARRQTEDALRHREEQLSLALDVARMGTWDWNLETGGVEWSENLEAIHGLPPGGFGGTLEALEAIIHPDDRGALQEAMHRALESESEYEVEFRVLPPGGATIWLSVRGRVFRDASGRPVRMVGVGLDITERMRVRRELEDAKEAAEGASLAKDQFLAVLSHELRTPLTPVLAAVSAMIDDPTTPREYRDILPMIRRNVELEARLIDDLLDITRISQGKLRLATEVVDAHELLEQALEICMTDLRDKGLRLESRLAAAAHHVEADPARLQQAFWNLIKNAVKFTHEGGLLSIRTSDQSGRLVVEVADTGIGIEPEALPRIFNAFDQGEASITRRFGGLGLGLAISRSVVEMLGGRITALSEGRDYGSTFRIELDAVAPPPVAPPAHSNHEPAARPDSPLRILLVEDNEDSLRVLARLLRLRGHEVATADTVAAAVGVAESGDFDLLVSDLGLPDGSGIDVMRHLRQRSEIPGIVLSGYGMESDQGRTREAGFSAHLIKPIDFAHLESTIRSVVTTGAPSRGSNER